MWKKSDDEVEEITPAAPSVPRPRVTSQVTATIGPSIAISGDVTGDEDLLVEGRVQGTIKLREHNVTIGQKGSVNADIDANVIVVEGESRGDLHAHERIIVKASGSVVGNVTAPRVVIEDGAKFKGSIDMDVSSSVTALEKGRPAAAASETKPVPGKSTGTS